jgi:asparagine synthase (glutamine-hydrolysing)
MCGIAGIISLEPSAVTVQRIRKMTDAIVHRGPDGEGLWINPTGNTGFGHRRLAVIDLSDGAAQPMHYNGRYTIIHNGEIYNYKELKSILLQKGYVFYTRSDTEVILAAYDCWKEECLKAFDGMFAFAIWDETTQTLFAARDRFGEKPFYYYQDDSVFVFASEMKGIFAGGIDRVVNENALCHFISLGYTQNPSNTFETYYRNITKLPAAHYLVYQLPNKKISTKAYWQLEHNYTDASINEKSAIEQLNELLQQSVEKRLRSDVAVGTSLSGGLDSSSIAAVASRQMETPGNFASFSAVFPGFIRDESAHISHLLKAYPIKNIQVVPTADGLAANFDRMLFQQEEPIGSASTYAQYEIFALARQHHCKVLLDGQGADEILAGYHKYYHWYWQELFSNNKIEFNQELTAARSAGISDEWNWKNKFAARFPKQTARLLMKRETRKALGHPWIDQNFLHTHFTPGFNIKTVVNKLNDILAFNTCVYGLEELLRYADRNAMAHGIELRLPFLSHHLVEFVFSLPSSFKIKNGWTKWVLRKSMEETLPKSIVWRKDKVGYEPPQQEWMNHPVLQERIQEAKRKLVQKGILQQKVMQKKNQPQDAYAAENDDWRWLVAAGLL